MILVDTSAWVEFLRGTGSPACERVDQLLGGDIATCPPVSMEVLAGARSESHLRGLRSLIALATSLPVEPAQYEHAALLYRRARAEGRTVRSLVDCLVAATAIDHDVPLLHADRDFGAIAATSSLRLALGTSSP